MKYLSVTVVTEPTLAANARGRGVGNNQVLQTISTPRGNRTVVSGPALKYAIRETLLRVGADMWRHHRVTETSSQFGYGVNLEPKMVDAVPTKQDEFDDTLLFGLMVESKGKAEAETEEDVEEESEEDQKARAAAEKASKAAFKLLPKEEQDRINAEEKAAKEAEKAAQRALNTEAKDSDRISRRFRSNVSVTPAISTEYHMGDQGFAQGHVATRTDLMPFTFDRHLTRYCYTLTFDLEQILKSARGKGAIKKVLSSLKALLVGGNQASNRSELVPEVVIWREHQEPGGGLVIPNSVMDDFPVDRRLTREDFAGVEQKFANLGIAANWAGLGVSEVPVTAIESIV
jgi:CRISPR-associated autoregulator DevR family